jgi:uncharacterized membrane protein YciS (DUF1049 family)
MRHRTAKTEHESTILGIVHPVGLCCESFCFGFFALKSARIKLVRYVQRLDYLPRFRSAM